MRWEVVALQTEWAYPDARAHVDLAERVEYGSAWRLAGDGFVCEEWCLVGLLLQRCVEGTDRDNQTAGFHAG